MDDHAEDEVTDSEEDVMSDSEGDATTNVREYTMADFEDDETDDWEREMQIQIARDSLHSVPEDDHTKRRVRMEVLGSQLRDRYLLTGKMADLQEAIHLAREALRITPEDFPYRSMYLTSLYHRLSDRYDRTGAITDLEESINLVQENLENTSKDEQIRPGRFNTLGTFFYERYMRIGALADLDKTIQCMQEAVNTTPEDDIYLRIRLHNLGYMLGQRYFRAGATTDLEQAIQTVRKSLDTNRDVLSNRGKYMVGLGIKPGDPARPVVLNSLGSLLAIRDRKTGSADDLQEAIDLAKQAVDATPEGYPDRAQFLASLGIRLRDRYLRDGAMEDLEEAIQVARQAVDATPEGSPWLAVRINSLGDQLGDKYSHTNAVMDLEEAISCYRSALRQSNARTIDRILSGKEVLQYCAMKSDWEQACQDSTIAVNLIPKLTARSLENSDKQHILSQVVGLACDATAVALNAGKTPLFALSLLEQGRAVLATSLEEIRTDIIDLQVLYPELATRFASLRNELDQPLKGNNSLTEESGLSFSQVGADHRYAAGNELDKLIAEIRQQPGLKNFLLPSGEQELQDAAKRGPIIVINVSEYRCDALLVEQHQVRSLALPNLSIEEIEQQAQTGGRGSPRVLAWLWDVVAKPVLDALGFTKPPPGNEWPHVWWIPTGPLSKFPLHAATGKFGKGSTEAVLERVMSSYSSSIKAIIYGRRRRTVESTTVTPNQALLVAMEHTPGNSRLPFASREIAMLHDLCKSMVVNPIQPGRSKQAIIAHLPQCQIFHFAGHGYTDDNDPSQSYLVLGEKEKDPLTVTTLLELNLRERAPFLAYLAACGTGEIIDEKFFDESIHLISACQLAGFRHVIGTLWEVNDESCVDMARITYEGLRDGGLTDDSVCLGLHNATRNLRDRWQSGQKQLSRKVGSTRKAQTTMTKERAAGNAAGNDKGKFRLPRKIVLDDSDEEDDSLLHWVPYVHFGV